MIGFNPMQGLLFLLLWLATWVTLAETNSPSLYRWTDHPTGETQRLNAAKKRLQQAIHNPEFMLHHWINLPTSPTSYTNKTLHLSLREAILLSLRYNPNIQNAELDRITQRYELRLAHNEFELQYALAGSAVIQRSRYSDAGTATSQSYFATPEIAYKNKIGTQAALKLDNTVQDSFGNFNPLATFSFTQPLMRGFGRSANEAKLLNAIDNEWLNKLNLQQSVSNQVTQVITAYRALVLSGNNLENQKHQLGEANKSYAMNEKKITAGQLEPTANIQQSYQIESLKLMVEQAMNDFKTAAQNLLETIGLDPDLHLAVPSDVTLNQIVIPNLEEAIQQGLTHNQQYLALKMLLRADERAYDVAKNQQLWQLDAKANIQAGMATGVDSNIKGFQGIYNGRNLTEGAGVTLTIPLRDIGRRNQLIAAKVRLEKDRLNIIAAKRALITIIKNTIITIQSQAKRYELAQRQVELATKSYELEKKKQQAGISSALDVSNTQNQLIQSQMGLISAKIAYLNQLSALQRILGTTLDEWDIKLGFG